MAKKKPGKKPKAKKAPATKKPEKEVTAKHLADLLGVKLTKPLDKDQILHLKKSLPGYAEQLDDAASQLKKDAKTLGLADVTPPLLEKAHHDHGHLQALELVAATVYRAIHEQRLLVDDHAIGMLQKISRRVGALSEDHPELLSHWKFLRDYLAHFHRHGSAHRPSRGGTGTHERPKGKTKATPKSSSDAPPDETPAEA